MARRLVAGNWKMHGTQASDTALVEALTDQFPAPDPRFDVLVCPAAIHIPLVASRVTGTGIQLGAQDVHPEPDGAHTGGISASMLADFGVSHVIVGHSERRRAGERDETVAAKFRAVIGHCMIPILCVGETLEQRTAQTTEAVVLGQLDAVLECVGIQGFAAAVVAYEPVWAIGTGVTATPAQAQEVHALIRRHLAHHDAVLAASVPLIYGGSVTAETAGALFAERDVDGGLVGGASLRAEDFIRICQSMG